MSKLMAHQQLLAVVTKLDQLQATLLDVHAGENIADHEARRRLREAMTRLQYLANDISIVITEASRERDRKPT